MLKMNLGVMANKFDPLGSRARAAKKWIDCSYAFIPGEELLWKGTHAPVASETSIIARVFERSETYTKERETVTAKGRLKKAFVPTPA